LGIKDVGKFNDDFLAKWKGHLGLGVRGMWRDILDSRYDDWRDMSRSIAVRNNSYY